MMEDMNEEQFQEYKSFLESTKGQIPGKQLSIDIDSNARRRFKYS